MGASHSGVFLKSCRDGDLDKVKRMVERRGVDVETRHTEGRGETGLLLAAAGGHLAVVEYLLDSAEANVNTVVKIGTAPSALAGAIGGGQIKTARLLLQHGADVEVIVEDEDGDRPPLPLISCAVLKCPEMVPALLEAGAPANARDELGNSPLYYAALYGQVEAVDALLAGGARVNMRCLRGRTALICAVRKGHLVVVETLIRRGADVSLADQEGHTVFEYAMDNASDTGADILSVLEEARDNPSHAVVTDVAHGDEDVGFDEPPATTSTAAVPTVPTTPVGAGAADGSVSMATPARECVICMERERNTCLLPCAHLCACIECAEKLDTCPMCRSRIQQVVRTFDVT